MTICLIIIVGFTLWPMMLLAIGIFSFFFIPLWCYQLKKHVSLQNGIFIQTESGWFLC